MTSIRLTSSHEIVRRMLVAACVVFALGAAGSVVGRAASRDEVQPVAAPTAPALAVASFVAPAIDQVAAAAAELASAKIAPALQDKHNAETPVTGRELLHDQATAARAEMTTPPAPMVALPVAPALPAAPKLKTIEMEVTAYCPCKKCCGPKAQGITASGKRVDYNGGRFVAADRSLKFGTKLIVPGYAAGQPVEVTDRGGAIKGNKLDVYFASHTEALKWGRQKLTVTVVE